MAGDYLFLFDCFCRFGILLKKRRIFKNKN